MKQGAENYDSLNELARAYESANSAYEQAGQKVQTAETSYISAESSVINAKETYDSEVLKATENYRQNLLSEQIITEDKDLEEIENYKKQIEDCVITAPTAGVVASLEIKTGDDFAGGTVFTMLDNEHFKITATVDEYDINNIVLGQKAYVKTNATGDVEMPATVSYVAVTSTSGQMSQSASYEIEITLDEPQSLLRTGMTASVSIELEGAAGVLAVPYDCVTTDKSGKSTITVVEGENQKIVEVKKGIETDYYVEISGDGLSEGLKVLLPTAIITNSSNGFEMGGFPGGDMGAFPGGGSGMPQGGSDFGGAGNFGGGTGSFGGSSGGRGSGSRGSGSQSQGGPVGMPN